MAATLSVRPNRLSTGSPFIRPPPVLPTHLHNHTTITAANKAESWRTLVVIPKRRRVLAGNARAGSRADDSAPFEMSVENALKLLGVSEGASFDDILRAKNAIVALCKDDPEAVARLRER